MNDFRHVAISITTYCNDPSKYYTIFFYDNDHGNKIIKTQNELSMAEALRIMWELKKRGGTKELDQNYARPGCCTRKVELWEFGPSWGI